MKDIDTIINFSAETHVDNSTADPSAFIKSNYEGVFNLLEGTRKYNLRFHQVSTDEVYGSLPLNSKERFSENSCYNPRNPYSTTKAAAGFLVRSYFNTYKIKATISNCSNNFGPNQHTEKLIPKTIINVLSGNEIPVYGERNQIRDWMYVEDHIRALELILEKGKYGETCLVSAENEVRNIDLVKNVLKILNKSEELIKFTNDRPGHDVRYSPRPQ
ncbi:MAG: GDP-mannose 4,6-dehydratase [Thermoplasmatales archaeon]